METNLIMAYTVLVNKYFIFIDRPYRQGCFPRWTIAVIRCVNHTPKILIP